MDVTSTMRNVVDNEDCEIDLSDIEGLCQSETMEKNTNEAASKEDLRFLFNVSTPLPEQYQIISVTAKDRVEQIGKKESKKQADDKVSIPSQNNTKTPDINSILELLAVNDMTTKQIKEKFLSDGYSYSDAALCNKLSYYRKRGLIDKRPGLKSTWFLVKKNDSNLMDSLM